MLAFGFLVGISALSTARDPERCLNQVSWGWAVAYCFTFAVASWEILTGEHLEGTEAIEAANLLGQVGVGQAAKDGEGCSAHARIVVGN